MTFCIITHTPHFYSEGSIYAYGPYVREMNLWIKNVDKVLVVTPFSKGQEPSKISLTYVHDNLKIITIPAISFTSLFEALKAVFYVPFIFFKIIQAIGKSDHIHLRCPGTIGLLGCIAQTFYPKKRKTAKYAGNWDPKAQQPYSYRLQKWWLSNTFLSKNINVLVYGDWPNQTKNIKPFFTASYHKNQILPNIEKKLDQEPKFLFVGNLSVGKQPKYAIELLEELRKKGFLGSLRFFGDGAERQKLQAYVLERKIESFVHFMGNQTASAVEKAYHESHFLILPSRSEGWPKVVAEAMFWGVIPVVTKISCVPWMLGQGERGILISGKLETDTDKIIEIINNPIKSRQMSTAAQKWSQQYTLEVFESELQKLLL